MGKFLNSHLGTLRSEDGIDSEDVTYLFIFPGVEFQDAHPNFRWRKINSTLLVYVLHKK